MAIEQTDIDALRAALAGGESRVRTADGKEVQYRSVPELQAALDRLIRDKNAQDARANGSAPRQVRLTHGGRGFTTPGNNRYG
jgi:hypothetical protein